MFWTSGYEMRREDPAHRIEKSVAGGGFEAAGEPFAQDGLKVVGPSRVEDESGEGGLRTDAGWSQCRGFVWPTQIRENILGDQGLFAGSLWRMGQGRILGDYV